jgi:hypothetical protein
LINAKHKFSLVFTQITIIATITKINNDNNDNNNNNKQTRNVMDIKRNSYIFFSTIPSNLHAKENIGYE